MVRITVGSHRLVGRQPAFRPRLVGLSPLDQQCIPPRHLLTPHQREQRPPVNGGGRAGVCYVSKGRGEVGVGDEAKLGRVRLDPWSPDYQGELDVFGIGRSLATYPTSDVRKGVVAHMKAVIGVVEDVGV